MTPNNDLYEEIRAQLRKDWEQWMFTTSVEADLSMIETTED